MFSSQNRITPERLKAKLDEFPGRRLCRRAWGSQTDIQSLGYDCLCGLAMMLFDRDSYKAVSEAQAEVANSSYSKGFNRGWDGCEAESLDEEYNVGYADGKRCAAGISWQTYSWRASVSPDWIGR